MTEPSEVPRPTRRLILMRHAKSAYPGGVTDHDRPLAPRGRREAALVGGWLADTQPPIDAVLCSDAVRARETLQHSGIQAPTTIVAELYGADIEDVIGAVRAAPADAQTVTVVAHAPGLPATAAALAGPGSDPAALSALRQGFPTAAIAVVAVDTDWRLLDPGRCRLLSVHRLRDPER